MAVRMVKCKYCGIQFDRNAEPFVEVSARRYAHKACADKHQAAIPQDEQDYAALETYIKKIFKEDNFVPNVIYCALRGGAYMANVISEYYKLAVKDKKIMFAAVSSHSYTGVHEANNTVNVEGWTLSPDKIKKDDKIMLIDDIYDSGNTINELVTLFLKAGISGENIKVIVHDYKVQTFKKQPDIKPDYWCNKIVVNKPEESNWIHYMSHELVGLTKAELEEHYFKQDPELRKVFEGLINK